MSRYANLPHIACGGYLEYEADELVNVVINKRAVKFGAKAIIKTITKHLFRCDKCDGLVNVVSCPSYEDYVLNGKIRVSKAEYWRIKNDRRRAGAIRT